MNAQRRRPHTGKVGDREGASPQAWQDHCRSRCRGLRSCLRLLGEFGEDPVSLGAGVCGLGQLFERPRPPTPPPTGPARGLGGWRDQRTRTRPTEIWICPSPPSSASWGMVWGLSLPLWLRGRIRWNGQEGWLVGVPLLLRRLCPRFHPMQVCFGEWWVPRWNWRGWMTCPLLMNGPWTGWWGSWQLLLLLLLLLLMGMMMRAAAAAD